MVLKQLFMFMFSYTLSTQSLIYIIFIPVFYERKKSG